MMVGCVLMRLISWNSQVVPARVVEGLQDRIWPIKCFHLTAGTVRNFFGPSAYGPRRLPALSTASRDGRAGDIMSRPCAYFGKRRVAPTATAPGFHCRRGGKPCESQTTAPVAASSTSSTGAKQIGRAVQQECRDRSRMPSSA
eukprot:TRINITY_DN23400_c0_g1_i2.p1 TRINITY_DN23400_c0_g1~~TRINITY_DN23400_c0_g1_i2.p1  ORF type:complete len:143 (+),score=8.14 TRINITY_DN23400_c0_g1_i2:62-490(+)